MYPHFRYFGFPYVSHGMYKPLLNIMSQPSKTMLHWLGHLKSIDDVFQGKRWLLVWYAIGIIISLLYFRASFKALYFHQSTHGNLGLSMTLPLRAMSNPNDPWLFFHGIGFSCFFFSMEKHINHRFLGGMNISHEHPIQWYQPAHDTTPSCMWKGLYQQLTVSPSSSRRSSQICWSASKAWQLLRPMLRKKTSWSFRVIEYLHGFICDLYGIVW